MIEKVSNKIFKYVLEYGNLDDNDCFTNNWIKYGIEILFSTLIGIINIIVISLLAKSLISGVIFLIIMISTRQFTGGYHANTYFKCNLCLVTLYSSVLLLSKSINFVFPKIIVSIILLIELLLIILICPIYNRFKPIKSQKQYYNCKFVSTILFLWYSILGLLMYNINFKISITIIYTLQVIVILSIIGYFKERRYKL